MVNLDYAKAQLETLPENALERVIEFISFQRYSLGLYDNDTDYLSSVPGMVESIKAAAIEPIEDGIPADEVMWGV